MIANHAITFHPEATDFHKLTRGVICLRNYNALVLSLTLVWAVYGQRTMLQSLIGMI